jgi:glutathione S-transferase
MAQVLQRGNAMKLIIGNKNYSSWSLRAWLLLATYDLSFEEEQVSLRQPGLQERLGQYSPVGQVPVLMDGALTVWDSLAIAEYINEQYLAGKAWPQAVDKRASARAICAEMHSSFMALRGELPMNCRATREVVLSAQAQRDIARVDNIWSECLAQGNGQGNGPWLFGDFSIADCFYAPVVLRFETYGITTSAAARRYQDTVLAHEPLQRWVSAGKAETEIVEEDEAGIDVVR